MGSSWLACSSLFFNPDLSRPILCFSICFYLILQFFHPHLLHFKHILIYNFALSSLIILKLLLISLNFSIFEHRLVEMLQISFLSLLDNYLSIDLQPLSHQIPILSWLKALPMLTNLFPGYLDSSLLLHRLCFLVRCRNCLGLLVSCL